MHALFVFDSDPFSLSISNFSLYEKFIIVIKRSRSTPRVSSLRSHTKRPVTRRVRFNIHISTIVDGFIFSCYTLSTRFNTNKNKEALTFQQIDYND